MRISYCFGMVDLLHYGHINAIKKASEESDYCIFGLVSDAASDAWFGAHVSNETERLTVIKSIKYIDEVLPQKTFDPIENLRSIHIRFPEAIITLYHGNEWGIISAKKYVESIGGSAVKLDYYDKLSPQRILDTLNKNETQNNRLSDNLISTKANTLLSLKDILKNARIEDIFVLTVGQFFEDPEYKVSEIQSFFGPCKIVVRSSSKREDAFEESNAGHFLSVLDVDTLDSNAMVKAINSVISSYGEDATEDEQVLIQRQTNGVLMSGVVFTRDIQRNRPYYVINYDSSGSTESVTSGAGGSIVWISREADREKVPKKYRTLMDAVWELEDILSGILLDIEFAVTADSVVIFQVRPLAAAYKLGRNNNDKDVYNNTKLSVEKYLKLCNENLTCFSDMAFWNPAEIIGDNPKNLDYSLYREIITKQAWDEGLVPMGYKPVPKELMFRFGNKPYISVERSFEALTPSSIPETLSSRLQEYYVQQLKRDFSAHDKIEFEISFNCFDFSLKKRIRKLLDYGFSETEIMNLEDSLKEITRKAIQNYDSYVEKDSADLKELEEIRIDIQNITKDCHDHRILAKSVRILLDAINRYGTPQFSRHARCAFIAKSICKSLVTEGFIRSSVYDDFMSSINTVAVEYDNDYHEVLRNRMSRDTFVSRYGHLRAGTYNIRSLRYDQMEQLFSEEILETDEKKQRIDESIDGAVAEALNSAMSEAPLGGVSGSEIVSFIKKATEQREYFKFVFTKSLSFAIELIKKMGSVAGIDSYNLSYLELPEVYSAEFYISVDKLREFWNLIIDRRKELFRIKTKMILPSVINSDMDFDCIENYISRPNYITESRISAEVLVLDDVSPDCSLEGKIIVLEKADPGFDWIFSKGIAGLITKYGGAASHMAIRCAEFRIPAAIGCGSSLFAYSVGSKRMIIDCKNEKLIRIE